MKQYFEELTVYDITANTGFKGANITGVINDTSCENWFLENSYVSNPEKTSSEDLIAQDALLSSTFKYKSYADVDAAKAGILSTTYLNWINENTQSASYAWINGKLKITMTFADESQCNTFLSGVKNNDKRTFLEKGVTISTVSS